MRYVLLFLGTVWFGGLLAFLAFFVAPGPPQSTHTGASQPAKCYTLQDTEGGLHKVCEGKVR